jgi:S1/P1 Nuclease
MARLTPLTYIFIAFQILLTVNAWGELGHRTVAYLAQMYFDDDTSTYVDNLLDKLDISNASLFADTFRLHHRFSAPWHYINARDDPPRVCKVNYRRDCAESCIIKAIVNQTNIVNNADDWTLEARQNATKFLIHFIGDIHQPLHTELEARGGTRINVKFDGHDDNLHAVWDKRIPEKLAKKRGDNYMVAAKKWAKKLHDAPTTGDEGHESALTCDDLNDAQDCALIWANDSNKFICSYVLKDDIDGVTGVDLGGDYYEGAIPIVEQLITRAGKRLAAWMKALQLQHDMQLETLTVQTENLEL